MKIKCFNDIIECEKAVKGKDYINIYIGQVDYPSCSYSGISDFSTYEIIEGEWSYPELTKEELLQAQIDYISMMTGIDMEVNNE